MRPLPSSRAGGRWHPIRTAARVANINPWMRIERKRSAASDRAEMESCTCNRFTRLVGKRLGSILSAMISKSFLSQREYLRRRSTCSVEGCTEQATATTRLCPLHYARVRRHGNPHATRYAGVLRDDRYPVERLRCDDCGDRDAQVRRRCLRCHQRWLRWLRWLARRMDALLPRPLNTAPILLLALGGAGKSHNVVTLSELN
jgi:hypothetical protein